RSRGVSKRVGRDAAVMGGFISYFRRLYIREGREVNPQDLGKHSFPLFMPDAARSWFATDFGTRKRADPALHSTGIA
ncbi:MAG: hypothetical protein QOH39_3420, partial [Verrucomicrobiota bacterium]